MHIFVPNKKFLCLNPWRGEVRTDDANANDDDANDGQSMSQKGQCSIVKSVCKFSTFEHLQSMSVSENQK